MEEVFLKVARASEVELQEKLEVEEARKKEEKGRGDGATPKNGRPVNAARAAPAQSRRAPPPPPPPPSGRARSSIPDCHSSAHEATCSA